MERHGPRNALKQSPEEGPKLDPQKVRKISDVGVNFGVVFGYVFFVFGSLGPLLAHFGPLLAHVGTLLARLRRLLPLNGVIWGPS